MSQPERRVDRIEKMAAEQLKNDTFTTTELSVVLMKEYERVGFPDLWRALHESERIFEEVVREDGSIYTRWRLEE